MVYFYYLQSPHTEIRYIGKTKMTLKQRLSKHISDYHHPNKRCGSEVLLKLGVEDVTIHLIIDKCEWTYEQTEAKEYEQKLIDESKYKLCNIRRAYCSPEFKKKYYCEKSKEYRQNNKEKVKAYKREYYQRDVGKQQQKDYKKRHPEKVKKWRETEKSKFVKCEVCSKDVSRNKFKRHMEMHNDVKVKCPQCDAMLRKGSIAGHIKRIHNGEKIVQKKVKEKCPHCDKVMLKKSIKRHISRQHT